MPTAVLLVNGFNGLGLATLMEIPRLFKGQFHNVIFVSVGEVDASLLKGQEEVNQLEQQIADDMLEYCQLVTDLGFHAEVKTGLGSDVVMELRRMCLEVANLFRRRFSLPASWSSTKRSTDSSAVFSTTIPRSTCFDSCSCKV